MYVNKNTFSYIFVSWYNICLLSRHIWLFWWNICNPLCFFFFLIYFPAFFLMMIGMHRPLHDQCYVYQICVEQSILQIICWIRKNRKMCNQKNMKRFIFLFHDSIVCVYFIYMVQIPLCAEIQRLPVIVQMGVTTHYII